MRKLIALAVAAGLMSGCSHAKWVDLQKPTLEQHFVLANDHVRTQKRGIGYTWVEGIRAGTYRLEAEDEEGLYFRGEGPCVIVLFDKAAEEFLETGNASNPRQGPVPGHTGFLNGGLFLPKTGVEKGPKLFFIVGDGGDQQRVGAATAASVQPQNAAQGAGAGVGGALVAASIASTKGTVSFVPYDTEKEFIAGLVIHGN